jgi:hypothetical protein
MSARGCTPTPTLPRKSGRGSAASPLLRSPAYAEEERSELLLPSPACGGGWRARQRATGGGSRHKFRYRMDPLCGPSGNDNKIKEDTL